MYLPDEEAPPEFPEELEILDDLQQHPLAINTASPAQIAQLLWLTDDDIAHIIAHRPYRRTDQLFGIGVDSLLIARSLPYISLRLPPDVAGSIQTGCQYSVADAQLPSSLKYTQKSRLTVNNFDGGVVMQKDAGEWRAADFLSWFVRMKSASWLKSITVGHYRMAFGQGIVLAPALGFSKGPATTTAPQKKYRTIKPYMSSYEVGDFRGAAAHVTLGTFELTGFWSDNRLTANLDDDGKITSIDGTGLHTGGVKDNISERNSGGILAWERPQWSASYLLLHTAFDHDFAAADQPQKYLAQSLAGQWHGQRMNFAGEVSRIRKDIAWTASLRWGLPQFRHLLLARVYPTHFPTHHGNPFSSQSNFANEAGIYYGFQVRLAKSLMLYGYADVWRFPQPRFFEKMPTAGSEEFLRISWTRSHREFIATMRHVSKEKQITLEESKIRDFQRLIVRLDVVEHLTNCVTTKTRMEFCSENLPVEKEYNDGILFYQQLRAGWKKWRITARLTTVYGSVLQYTWEPDINGVFSTRVFQDDRLGAFILVETDLRPGLRMQIKYRSEVHHTQAGYLSALVLVTF